MRPVAAGNITLFWSFPNGTTCAQTPAASYVHVRLVGSAGEEALENNGWFNCTIAGADGVTLLDFAPGTYSFQIDAYDYSQQIRYYTASGTLVVDGNVQAHVSLAPAY